MATKREINEKVFIANCKKVQAGEMNFEELVSALKFRFYIPIEDKISTTNLIDTMASDSLSAEIEQLDEILEDLGVTSHGKTKSEVIKDYEVVKLICVVSNYIGVQLTTYSDEVYDLLHNIGLVDYIISKTTNDWNKFNEIVDKVTGIEHYSLTEIFMDLFNDIPTQDKLKDFERILGNLEEDKVKELYKILEFNDPLTAQVTQSIKTEAIEKALKKGKDGDKIKKLK